MAHGKQNEIKQTKTSRQIMGAKKTEIHFNKT